MPDRAVVIFPKCKRDGVSPAEIVLPNGQRKQGWVCEESDCWHHWIDESEKDDDA